MEGFLPGRDASELPANVPGDESSLDLIGVPVTGPEAEVGVVEGESAGLSFEQAANNTTTAIDMALMINSSLFNGVRLAAARATPGALLSLADSTMLRKTNVVALLVPPSLIWLRRLQRHFA